MSKDFPRWNFQKQSLDIKEEIPYFYEREIWWASFGVNIGSEENGKGEEFARPCVILKKYNKNFTLVVPLSTTKNRNQYTFEIGLLHEKENVGLLSQTRPIGTQRLISKIGNINKQLFEDMKTAFRNSI